MSYEEKYKEALNRADSLTEKYGGREFAEYVFPELAESEDERIRKELKEAFEAYDIESTWNGIPIRSVFAWLEKQKEQKPVISDDAIREGVVHFGITQYQINNWLKKHINVIEQKPLRWSEKDEKNLKSVVSTLWFALNTPHFPLNYERIIELETWLKSLRPQPKQEWSENDEKILNELLDHCNTENATWYNWLKSLRPSWKPSEEQMKALQNAVALTACDKELARLYNQLKKL